MLRCRLLVVFSLIGLIGIIITAPLGQAQTEDWLTYSCADYSSDWVTGYDEFNVEGCEMISFYAPVTKVSSGVMSIQTAEREYSLQDFSSFWIQYYTETTENNRVVETNFEARFRGKHAVFIKYEIGGAGPLVIVEELLTRDKNKIYIFRFIESAVSFDATKDVYFIPMLSSFKLTE